MIVLAVALGLDAAVRLLLPAGTRAVSASFAVVAPTRTPPRLRDAQVATHAAATTTAAAGGPAALPGTTRHTALSVADARLLRRRRRHAARRIQNCLRGLAARRLLTSLRDTVRHTTVAPPAPCGTGGDAIILHNAPSAGNQIMGGQCELLQ